MESINRLQLAPKLAVTASYDLTNYSLEDITGEPEFFGVFWLPNRYEKLETRDTIGPLTGELSDTYRAASDYLDGEDLETALIKRATRAGYAAAAYMFNNQGYWKTAVFYADNAEFLPGLKNEIDTWFEGEIYELAIWEEITWTNSRLEKMTTWEVMESVCCVTGVNVYDDTELKAAALEYFRHVENVESLNA